MLEKIEAAEKVKKLLAKANDHAVTEAEAQAYMLAAQRLMAKYDVDASMAKSEVQAVLEKPVETYRNWNYRIELAWIISDNFKCKFFLRGNVIWFCGHKNDLDVATQVYEYAYKIISSLGSREYHKAKNAGKSTDGVFIAYGAGFCIGLKTAFKNQVQTQALMVLPSQDVNNYVNKLCNPVSTITGNDEQSLKLKKELQKLQEIANKKARAKQDNAVKTKMQKINKNLSAFSVGVKDGKEFANKDKAKLNSGK